MGSGQEQDERTVFLRYAAIASRAIFAVGIEASASGVEGGFGQEVRGAVGGPVVDDDHVERGVGLGRQQFETVCDEPPPVPRGNDYGYAGFHGGSPAPYPFLPGPV